MKVMLTGPTGAVGGEALRRPLVQTNPKLQVELVPNFRDLAVDLTGIDICFYALGVSQTHLKNPAAYRGITYGSPMGGSATR